MPPPLELTLGWQDLSLSHIFGSYIPKLPVLGQGSPGLACVRSRRPWSALQGPGLWVGAHRTLAFSPCCSASFP